ncbi:MAG: hypothetical protein MR868_03530 [Lachnospiraceae bacterium]|nr:hypothetical protein [Lachnospiraceae bacterium]
MTKSEMVTAIKQNLALADGTGDLTISDAVLMVCSYCNIPLDNIQEELEPFIRKKVKGILDYESVNGTGYRPEVASIKEGDGSITWAQTDGNTRASIYGLNDSDKSILRRYRRLRGYA